jgi:hypothetical protein
MMKGLARGCKQTCQWVHADAQNVPNLTIIIAKILLLISGDTGNNLTVCLG